MSDHPAPLIVPAVKRARLTRAFLQLKRLVQRRQNHVRLETVLNLFGQDGLLVINTVLAILNVVLSPLQGISMPLGFIQIMVITALLRQQKTFWLPRRWRSYPLPTATIEKNVARWLPFLYSLEKISHPRAKRIMRQHTMRRFSLWILLFLAVVVAAPLPFMNITPSIAVILISFGLLNYDGLMWILGMIVLLAHSYVYFIWEWFYPHLVSWLPFLPH